MKVYGYLKAHALKDFSIVEANVADPTLAPQDVLVRIKAISVNPVDFKIRSSRSSKSDKPVVLGWDAAGVIEKVSPGVKNFKVGDEVYYAGDLMRDGSYAELQAVDARLIALKPKTLGFGEAAALPLTALTAWEGLIEKHILPEGPDGKVLVIGGAGGVGSIAIQIIKAMSQCQVIATASRKESADWAKSLGADLIIDHKKGIMDELKKNNIDGVHTVFITSEIDGYLPTIPDFVLPFGNVLAIGDSPTVNISHLKRKAISFHWELMFTKSLNQYRMESQGEILKQVGDLIDKGKIKTTVNHTLKGLNAENIKKAHEIVESGASIGKVVITA